MLSRDASWLPLEWNNMTLSSGYLYPIAHITYHSIFGCLYQEYMYYGYVPGFLRAIKGYFDHFLNSISQWFMTVAGQRINTGPNFT